MAAKEDLYTKVAPRMQRQNRAGTVKHGNSLDVLLSMGFPKTRAHSAVLYDSKTLNDNKASVSCVWSHHMMSFSEEIQDVGSYDSARSPVALKITEHNSQLQFNQF
ncbi:hypothetical protein DNTS_012854 [Danionella cerebrum]|uniref:Uncharacterized protein n=1 Tax=Danionella cerebrum TaxID=2873325 RepID=A0A553QTP2_9TELE|nr:hypothetical protein DNTS_012854 [Danionella translucida]